MSLLTIVESRIGDILKKVAVQDVSLNPVRARLVDRAEDWPWSSVRAHLAGKDDELVSVRPALERYGGFAPFLGEQDDDADAWQALRRSETSGRPLGSAAWLNQLEIRTGRALAPRKRGPKPRQKAQIISKLAPNCRNCSSTESDGKGDEGE
ncbi:MAG: hypothetical protein ACREMY_05355 [bacterium]